MHRSKQHLYSITSSAVASKEGGTVRPKRLRGLKVDGELELGWLLNRQVGAAVVSFLT
jgi:hypothetical protein